MVNLTEYNKPTKVNKYEHLSPERVEDAMRMMDQLFQTCNKFWSSNGFSLKTQSFGGVEDGMEGGKFYDDG